MSSYHFTKDKSQWKIWNFIPFSVIIWWRRRNVSEVSIETCPHHRGPKCHRVRPLPQWGQRRGRRRGGSQCPPPRHCGGAGASWRTSFLLHSDLVPLPGRPTDLERPSKSPSSVKFTSCSPGRRFFSRDNQNHVSLKLLSMTSSGKKKSPALRNMLNFII